MPSRLATHDTHPVLPTMPWVPPAMPWAVLERLRENLADFNEKLFKNLYQNRLDGQILGHVLVQIFLNS